MGWAVYGLFFLDYWFFGFFGLRKSVKSAWFLMVSAWELNVFRMIFLDDVSVFPNCLCGGLEGEVVLRLLEEGAVGCLGFGFCGGLRLVIG